MWQPSVNSLEALHFTHWMEGGQEQEARDQGIDTQTHADRRARTESVISFLSTDIFIAVYTNLYIRRWSCTMEIYNGSARPLPCVLYGLFWAGRETEEKRKSFFFILSLLPPKGVGSGSADLWYDIAIYSGLHFIYTGNGLTARDDRPSPTHPVRPTIQINKRSKQKKEGKSFPTQDASR